MENQHEENKLQDSQQDFIVLEAMTPQEQMKMILERKQNLTEFYTTNQPYEISSWYQQLSQFTFKSYKTQILAIDAFIIYWLYYNDHDISKMQNQRKQLFQYYQKLIDKIDRFLLKQCKYFLNDNKVEYFMKLATRSPKDFGYKYSQHQIQQISQLLTSSLLKQFPSLKQEQKKSFSKDFINEIYRFFLNYSKQKFKIQNANDFVNIFSNSERIIIDLSDFSFLKNQIFEQFSKGNYEKAQQPFIQLWARQWKQFNWFQEIRCFFCDDKITAISQYDQRCFFPEIQGKKILIRNKILQFFQKMKPSLEKLRMSEGVMDIVLFGIQKATNTNPFLDEIKLIEINVFNRNSRASLFSWDKDFQVLKGETGKQVEVRIIQQSRQISKNELVRLMGMIQKGTSQIIQKMMTSLGLSETWQNFE